MAKIQHFPQEVLRRVFIMLLHDGDEKGWAFEHVDMFDVKLGRPSPILQARKADLATFGAVCRLWRDLALRYRKLLHSVHVDDTAQSPPWLTRSEAPAVRHLEICSVRRNWAPLPYSSVSSLAAQAAQVGASACISHLSLVGYRATAGFENILSLFCIAHLQLEGIQLLGADLTETDSPTEEDGLFFHLPLFTHLRQLKIFMQHMNCDPAKFKSFFEAFAALPWLEILDLSRFHGTDDVVTEASTVPRLGSQDIRVLRLTAMPYLDAHGALELASNSSASLRELVFDPVIHIPSPRRSLASPTTKTSYPRLATLTIRNGDDVWAPSSLLKELLENSPKLLKAELNGKVCAAPFPLDQKEWEKR